MPELNDYLAEYEELTRIDGKISKLTDKLSDAEQVYKFLVDNRKDKIAEVISSYDQNESIVKLEYKARASNIFRTYRDAIEKAGKEYFRLKYQYDTYMNRCEALRSFISLSKEQMKL